MASWLTLTTTMILLTCTSCKSAPEPTDDQVIGSAPAERNVLIDDAMAYRVLWQEDSIRVVFRLVSPPPNTRLFLPEGAKITLHDARDEAGPIFTTIDRSANHIDISTTDSEWVELEYTVGLEARETRLAPSFHNDILVLLGPTFLVLPARQLLSKVGSVPIEVHIPKSWQVLTTWQESGRKSSATHPGFDVIGMRAEEGTVLSDAFFVAGNLKIENSGPHRIAFSKQRKLDPRVPKLVDNALDLMAKKLGSQGTANVFIQDGSGDPSDLDGLGRRNGFVVKLPESLSSQSTLLIFHEAIHLWNGHWLVPRDQEEEKLRWFVEGVTHYLALKLGCESGHLSEDFAWTEVAQNLGAYEQNPVRTMEPVGEIDHLRFPYDHGFVLAFYADLTRRPNVEIFDWLNYVAKSSAPPARYSSTDVRVALDQISANSTLIWQFAESRVPVDHVLREAGLHLLPPTSSRPPKLSKLEGVSKSSHHLFSACATHEN